MTERIRTFLSNS